MKTKVRGTVSNAKQILALLKSRAEGDDQRFFSIALQVAAAEARQGRRQSAEEMRLEIDKARARDSQGPSVAISFAQPRGDLEGLLEVKQPRFKLSDVVLGSGLVERMSDVLRQQRKREWLREHGKTPSRRLLFVGPPGSGKTMSAEALAGELNVPLFVIRLETLITQFMGQTAAKLRLVFDETAKHRGVYLFDEFDAVGGRRVATNDVAEMRRVLNSFLQFMEEENTTDSLIVCSTNHPSLLDGALLRRYDQVLEFDAPSSQQIKSIIKRNLKPMKAPRLAWNKIVEAADGLSQSEIVRAVDDCVKTAILDERNVISTSELENRLNERRNMRVAFSKNEQV
jgi:SpoVK/Ycf46/Vps4 family AAA+-type ATPase|tara:strand:+ start:257 stop:1282 length:1026 start_codon:yes stop_codon:yes gene_type:complete